MDHFQEQAGPSRLPTSSQQRRARKSGSTSTKSRDWDAAPGAGAAALRPDVSFVSPGVASTAMRRFLAARVAEEGFERAEGAALARLELEAVAFIEQLFARAKAYADVASRACPSPADVLAAAEEHDIDVAGLVKERREGARRARKRQKVSSEQNPGSDTGRGLGSRLELVAPTRRSASPDLLPSDDENTAPVVPQTLRSLPAHLPPLPPKHTYLRTPVPPPKKQALPSLEKKLENAALVQESLRSLLLATEVDTDTNDGELFGGVVNWEATRHPRKKWKIAS
ncbi:hypothetical protein DFH11DRAFT_1727875 [Phellopilus nigrolimitatus]|nr:hypothetical protein DFH11DRAFT_1727875 [Phellopilus nigrolimitatus]